VLGATLQNPGRRMIGSLAVAIVLPVTYSKADNPRIVGRLKFGGGVLGNRLVILSHLSTLQPHLPYSGLASPSSHSNLPEKDIPSLHYQS